jgi:hypothetical protein
MRSILLTVPDDMKAQLDALRGEKGYSLNGYCRVAIARALAEEPKRPRGAVNIVYRKPGSTWKRRRIARRHLEREVVRLENQGAEIQVWQTGQTNE